LDLISFNRFWYLSYNRVCLLVGSYGRPSTNTDSTCVDAWMEHAAGLPAARLVDLFDLGFAAMWRRAHLTLGEVTLTAIVDRVLYSAAERFPGFSALAVDTNGLRFSVRNSGSS